MKAAENGKSAESIRSIGLLCWRSTLSGRAMLTYLALGAFISFSMAGRLFRAVNPYGDANTGLLFTWNLAQLALELLLLLSLVCQFQDAHRDLAARHACESHQPGAEQQQA